MSDELLDRLVRPGGPVSKARRDRRSHPDGFEPGVHITGDEGHVVAVAEPGTLAVDWSGLLTSWGLDPDHFQVLDDQVEFRTWEAAIGDGQVRTMHYYKARVRRRTSPIVLADVAQLQSIIARRRPLKARPKVTGGGSAVLNVSDWQIGKDDGDGTVGTVLRVLNMIDDVLAWLDERAKLDRPVVTLYIVGLGDLVEGTCDFYAQQSFRVELDRRDQAKLTWRLLLTLVTACADHRTVTRLVVSGVGGNHGENRSGGASFTTFNDNDDLVVLEVVRDVLKANPDRYGHVEFAIPTGDDSLTVAFDIEGVIAAWVHGHQAKRGAGAGAERVWRWWDQQRAERVPGVGDADLLWSAHYHYYSRREEGAPDDAPCPRIHVQVPAMDGGSAWFTQTTGRGQPAAGTVVSLVGERWGGLHDLAILRGRTDPRSPDELERVTA